MLRKKALTSYYALRDGETPFRTKAIVAAALVDLLSPVDVIPEMMLPGLGFTDDATAVTAALLLLSRSIRPEHRDRAAAKLSARRA